MLLSFALIFLCGMILGGVFKKIKLPPLMGTLITGIVLGPHVLNMIDSSILGISTDLRQVALIIILTRAGLNLNIEDLKKVGRPAILMSFVPACFEIAGMLLLAPKLMGISLTEAALLGTVIAAVSPAVIVPSMLKMIDGKYGTKQGIPQLIMAGASVDDVFVIVLFSCCAKIASGEGVSTINLFKIPTAILLGMAGGIIIGLLLILLFKKLHLRDSLKVVITLSISFLFVTLENSVTGNVGFSGMLAVMCMGIVFNFKLADVAKRLSAKYSKLWVAAEIMLFVLVGAEVDITYALSAAPAAIALIFGALLFRVAGVMLCLIKTKLNIKERLFCMISYTPKATVQAAIGALPLSMGLSCGNVVLTVAVLAILITAPLGAFLIDLTYKRLLKKE